MIEGERGCYSSRQQRFLCTSNSPANTVCYLSSRGLINDNLRSIVLRCLLLLLLCGGYLRCSHCSSASVNYATAVVAAARALHLHRPTSTHAVDLISTNTTTTTRHVIVTGTQLNKSRNWFISLEFVCILRLKYFLITSSFVIS